MQDAHAGFVVLLLSKVSVPYGDEVEENVGTRFDVIIVGAGIAGLTTAVAATIAGMRPVVLEKTDLIGGVSSWSYGTIWVGANDQAAAAGLKDNEADVERYLEFLSTGENDPARTRAFATLGPDMLVRLRSVGISFELIAGMGDLLAGSAPGATNDGRLLDLAAISAATIGINRSRLRVAPGPEEWRLPKSVVVRQHDRTALAKLIEEAAAADQLAQGVSIIGHLLRVLDKCEVPILTKCHVERLVRSGNRVVGVTTIDGRSFAGRAVMIATGNYLADLQLVAALDQIPGYRPWCPSGSTGDGLRMAAEIGGSIHTTRNNRGIFLGFGGPIAKENALAGVPSTRDLARAHCIVVNRMGRRFSNEVLFQNTALALREIDIKTRTPLNLPCWLICDQHYVDQWGIADTAPGTVPEWAISAPDIAKLAAAAVIDAEGLADTIARFNRFAESGIDEDFSRAPGWKMAPSLGTGRNASLGAIVQGPFYAAQLWPTLGIGGSGIKTDATARVMNWQGKAIPGLYAAGDVTLHDEFGTGYQAGITLSAAMVFAFAGIDDIRSTLTESGAE